MLWFSSSAFRIVRFLSVRGVQRNPGHFEWTEFQTPNVIADDVLMEFQRRARVFVSDAHDTMVNEVDIRKYVAFTLPRSNSRFRSSAERSRFRTMVMAEAHG